MNIERTYRMIINYRRGLDNRSCKLDSSSFHCSRQGCSSARINDVKVSPADMLLITSRNRIYENGERH